MHLRQLESFYWVARLGSFHAAARRLDTTQSTISLRIRELERQLGAELFDRGGRNAMPTARGRELVRHAEEMLRIATAIREQVGRPQALAGIVRVGVTGVPASTWLPSMLRRLAQAYPDIAIEVTVDTSETLQRQLLTGELGVALLSADSRPADGVDARPAGRIELGWLASPALVDFDRPVTPRDLQALAVISDVRGNRLHAIARDWFATAGAAPTLHHACASLETRLRLAAEGVGVALAAPAAAVRHLDDGRLRVLEADPPLPALDYVLATVRAELSPAVRVVATAITERLAGRDGLRDDYVASAIGERTRTRMRSVR